MAAAQAAHHYVTNVSRSSICGDLTRNCVRSASRLPVVCRVRCSASGSANGNSKPAGGLNGTATRGLNESFRPTSDDGDDISTRRTASYYYEQGEKPKTRVEPASGMEVPEGEDPFRLLDNGQKVYLDELDVISLLDPPPYLRPFQASHYNHAAFLWKKIGDIPEERRHRLLDLLLPRQITKMWEIAKIKYDDPDIFVDDAESLISKPALENPGKPIVWDGRVTDAPWYYRPFTRFQKIFFSKNGRVYGRLKAGGIVLEGLQARVAPLYFEVRRAEVVMATDEFCDLVLDYGDGQLHLKGSLPPGFPQPGRPIPPFNDKACDYIRAVGPGVVVGQGWVEGVDLEQVPKKLFGEFLLVKRFVEESCSFCLGDVKTA
ncbi:hypothetical protein R1sor_001005 [Riccia sorocarpa]|uniref:Uncharacterized protein n=1 Tax=Riccia sorocarpa TaxID=122646 RepID=A0ABD3GUS2_9MARC